MDNPKDNEHLIEKIITHFENIVEFLKGVNEEQFSHSKILQSAVCFEFVQIYEAAKKINLEFLTKIKDFPINEIRGLRNRVVHEYGNVDYTIIFETAKKDVPALLKKLYKVKIDLMKNKKTNN